MLIARIMPNKCIFSKCFSQSRRTQGVTRNAKVGPAGGWGACQQRRLALTHARVAKANGEATMQCAKAVRCAIKNSDGQQCCNAAPCAPTVKAREIIRPHEPHELMAGVVRLEVRDGIDGIAQAHPLLDIEDADAWVTGDRLGARETLRIISKFMLGFKGIMRAHQPPDFIKLQALQCLARDVQMPGMGGVEGTTQQTNATSTLHAPPRMVSWW